MIGTLFCVVALIVTYVRGRRSLGDGFLCLLTVGYAYGLLRARVADVGAHFVFDAALIGLYAARFGTPASESVQFRSHTARVWTVLLMGWPLVCMMYSPFIPDSQPLMVQLVGLRGAVLMLPCIVLGARMTREDLNTIAPGLAVLNVIALGFAILEYIYGIETFIPRSAVTDIVYLSQDVEGGGSRFYRIPSTFLASHAYGGTMALSVPFVAHGLESGRRVRILCWVGLGAAVLGTFLCGSRLPVITFVLATIYVVGSLRMRISTIFAFALAAVGVAYVVASLERFQRFTTLSDTTMVARRLNQSVSMSFFDVLTTYPIGAGLASAAGTSIPYFLANTDGIHAQFGLESEYGRILLEEGAVGLALWAAFIIYSTFQRQKGGEASPTAGAYMHALAVISWFTGFVGTGVLLSIPGAPLILVAVGSGLMRPAPVRTALALRHIGAPRRSGLPAGPAIAPLAVPRTSR